MKTYPLVIVTWKDHTSCDHWLDVHEAEENAVLDTVVSVGWLLKETDEVYVLIGGQSDEAVTNMQTIAKGTVIKKEVILDELGMLHGLRNSPRNSPNSRSVPKISTDYTGILPVGTEIYDQDDPSAGC